MISTTFDALFQQFAGGIPVAFLRALSYKESSQQPSAMTGSAKGLFQITPIVLDGYNAAHGTHLFPAPHLFDPKINTKVAADLLGKIARAYDKHPSPNLKTNWANPEWVKLVLAGWNSGYSEGGGVGKVASYLEARGIPVTHDNVFAYAGAAGATQHLQNSAKQGWQRSVASLFYSQGDWNTAIGIGMAGLALLGVAAYFLFLRR